MEEVAEVHCSNIAVAADVPTFFFFVHVLNPPKHHRIIVSKSFTQIEIKICKPFD